MKKSQLLTLLFLALFCGQTIGIALLPTEQGETATITDEGIASSGWLIDAEMSISFDRADDSGLSPRIIVTATTTLVVVDYVQFYVIIKNLDTGHIRYFFYTDNANNKPKYEFTPTIPLPFFGHRYSIYAEAYVKGTPFGSDEVTQTTSVTIIDDDNDGPQISIINAQQETDADPHGFQWSIQDPSGVQSAIVEVLKVVGYEWIKIAEFHALTGTYIPVEFGEYYMRITATDNDRDRPYDTATSITLSHPKLTFIDDDTTPPTLDVLHAPSVINSDEAMRVRVKAIDASGIAEMWITSEGNNYPVPTATVTGTLTRSSSLIDVEDYTTASDPTADVYVGTPNRLIIHGEAWFSSADFTVDGTFDPYTIPEVSSPDSSLLNFEVDSVTTYLTLDLLGTGDDGTNDIHLFYRVNDGSWISIIHYISTNIDTTITIPIATQIGDTVQVKFDYTGELDTVWWRGEASVDLDVTVSFTSEFEWSATEFLDTIIPIPTTIGEHSFTVTAIDGDTDRPNDQLTTTETFTYDVVGGVTALFEEIVSLVETAPDGWWVSYNRHKPTLHKIGETIDLWTNGEVEEAYDKLVHDIKPKLTGLKENENGDTFGNGIFKNPWIINDEAQTIFNDLINAILIGLYNPPHTPPIALFSAPTTVDKKTPVTFDGRDSFGVVSDLVEWHWDFDDGTFGSGATISHSFQHSGTYAVTLTVTDALGTSASVTHTITVTNHQPIALFTWAPLHVQPWEDIVFNAAPSFDPNGDVMTYEWLLSGQPIGTGETFTYAFTSAGTYHVQLVVTDDDIHNPLSATITHTLTANSPPEAVITMYPTGQILWNTPVIFDATLSSDPDNDPLSYHWEITGEFGFFYETTDPVFTLTFIEPMLYNAELTVEDSHGRSNTVSVLFEVLPTHPNVVISAPNYVLRDQEVTFDAYLLDGWIIDSYYWDFGDGTSGYSDNWRTKHTYHHYGDFQVTVVVTDIFGQTGTATHYITVSY